MFRYPIPWLVTLLLASASCSSSDDQPRTGPSREPSSGSSVGIRDRDYPLVGIVEELDRESGRVVIRHEAIPGFMPAMAMPFDLKGQEVLDDLQVGDKVEGRLIVSAESSRLTDVVITALADPKAVVSGRAGEGTGGRPPLMPGGAVPDFAMTTQTGETLRLSELRGKVVVLTFIYTRCPLPEFCPLMDRKFGELARGLAIDPDVAEKVRLLSVSFDPEHDTPEVLRGHARRVGAAPPLWTITVASHEELRNVAEALGLTYGPTGREIRHSLSTALIDPRGRLARLWTGNAWSVAEARSVVNSLLPDDDVPR